MKENKVIKIDKFKVAFHNKEETLRIKKEVFSQHGYYVELPPSAKIIDAGAHIGLSTLYFKKQYPGSEITAIEPHPLNFKLLEENIWENNLAQVVTVEAALAAEPGQITLNTDEHESWLSTTSVVPQAWNGQQNTKPVRVQAITLSSLLTQPIDLLKMDIEGQELAVLKEAHDKLYLVQNMLIEFHPHSGQSLTEITELLESKHFKLSYSKNGGTVPQHKAAGLVLINAVLQ